MSVGIAESQVTAGARSATAPWMLGPGIINLIEAPGSLALSAIVPVARQVGVCAFFLGAAVSNLTHLDGYFGCNLAAGSHFVIGIYDSSGSLLWTSGALFVPNTGFAILSYSVPSLSLAIGNYFYGWTADDAGNTTSFGSSQLQPLIVGNSTSGGNVVNQGTVRIGTAANAAAVGPVLPNTLGVIALPPTTFRIPLAMFR